MTAALLILLAAAAAPAAAKNPGVTAEPILQVPMGSRALGMGSAFTAVASDVSALYYNPAGLSRLNAHEVAATYASGLSDNNLQQYAYGGPLPFSGISGNGYATLGASLLYASGGTLVLNQTNPDGSFSGSSNIKASQDLIYTMGYSERVGTTPLDLRSGASYGINHFVGVTGKAIRSTLASAYSDSAFTADAGYLVNSPEAGMSLGISALNIGGELSYKSSPDPLPTTLRAGWAWQGGLPGEHNFTVATDFEYLLHEQQYYADAGAEYVLMRQFAFRLGYQFLRDAVGLTAGVGFRWRSRFLIDYAFQSADSLSSTHRFTITWRFGGVNPSLRARERRPFIESRPEHEGEPVESMEQQKPEPARQVRPRQEPREKPVQPGVPGWIY